MDPYQHCVHYYETDKMGIVHHSNYIRWMEEARVYVLAQVGWPFEKLASMGIASPVLSVECRYKTACAFAETVSIAVKLEELQGVRLRLAYEMRNAAGKLVCEGSTEHCFLGENGRPLRLTRDLPEFCEALQQLA